MTAFDILISARQKIAFPERWTQRTMARDGTGAPVEPTSNSAICWCAMGAIAWATSFHYNPEATHTDYVSARDYLLKIINSDSGVGPWNDNPRRKHKEVLAAFDKAIALAKGGS